MRVPKTFVEGKDFSGKLEVFLKDAAIAEKKGWVSREKLYCRNIKDEVVLEYDGDGNILRISCDRYTGEKGDCEGNYNKCPNFLFYNKALGPKKRKD